MSYFLIVFAGMLAGWRYYALERRSIWNTVEAGCVDGCLIACLMLFGLCVVGYLVVSQQRCWLPISILSASLYGTYLFLLLVEYLRKGKENDPP
ncbi:MAG: hypothetical protein PHH13_04850 [Candidatus Peribacteraceae bacterium]|nr:hypothetical protein [Candidatus Peribacteraceae bacterium]